MAAPSTFVTVPELSAFFGPPARRVVVFRSFAYWQVERRVFGTIIWGRPNEADVDEMCAAHEVGADPLFAATRRSSICERSSRSTSSRSNGSSRT